MCAGGRALIVAGGARNVVVIMGLGMAVVVGGMAVVGALGRLAAVRIAEAVGRGGIVFRAERYERRT